MAPQSKIGVIIEYLIRESSSDFRAVLADARKGRWECRLC